MAPEKAKALLAACYALLSGRLLKSATKGMRCYELTSCKLAVCIQIYSIQFNTSEIHHSQIHKILSQPHRGWDVTLEVFELLWKIVNIPYQHDQHNNFKFLCQNLISWLHVVFVISSRKVFPPTGAHKAQDETLRAHRARLSARQRKSSAAPRLEWKGVAKGQRGLTLVGNIQASSIFLHSSEYFSTRTQVTNTNKYSSSVLGSHCLLWYLNNMEYCKAHRLIVAPWLSSHLCW